MPLKKKIVFQTAFATYTAIDLIGEGGAGYVYKCQDVNGGFVAVKLLKPQNISDDRLKRFKNEILFCEHNVHQNILTIIDRGSYIDDGKPLPFYVMPLYESSLRSLLKAGIQGNSILPLFAQLLDGVEAAHLKKVIHRDLKPENVFYKESQNRLVVADFGIARFQEEELYTAVETKAEDRLANFQYAAPEQRKRGAPTDVRTDVYPLGLMLNEMFTGEVPQGTGYKTIESVSKDYSYLDDLVSYMLRQTPSDRPATIDTIKRELIGRKNGFIERQHLSELRNTVIPISEIDDPLILDPPHLEDFDWENGLLTMKLSRPVNDMWKWAFRNLGTYQAVSGKSPSSFELNGQEARIRAEEREVQIIINYFKSWLPAINQTYEQKAKELKLEEETKLKIELQAKIDAEEARQRLRKSVKI